MPTAPDFRTFDEATLPSPEPARTLSRIWFALAASVAALALTVPADAKPKPKPGNVSARSGAATDPGSFEFAESTANDINNGDSRAVNFRGRLLYTSRNSADHDILQWADPNQRSLTRIHDFGRLVSHTTSSLGMVRPAILGDDIYIVNVRSNLGAFTTDIFKGEVSRETPNDFSKIKWTTLPVAKNDLVSFWRSAEVDTLSVADKEGSFETSIYAITGGGDQLRAFRYERDHWDLVQEHRADNVFSVSVAKIQIPDGTYRLATAWIEKENQHWRWKLAIFDGRTFKEVPATAEVPIAGLSQVAVAYGTIQGDRTQENLLQVFIGSTDGGNSYLYRAQYDIGNGDGTAGHFQPIGGADGYLAPFCLSQAGGQPIWSKGFRKFWASHFSAFTYVKPDGDSGDYRTFIGLLGADSTNKRLVWLTRGSNRLLRYGYDGANPANEIRLAGKQHGTAVENYGDPDSWLLLGVIYGAPPFALNGDAFGGEHGGADRSSFEISTSESARNAVTVAKETTVTPSLAGSFFKDRLGIEASVADNVAVEEGESTEVVKIKSTEVGPPAAAPANLGYIVVIKPTLRVERLKVADWAGNLIPSETGGFSLILSRVIGWERALEEFDMTAPSGTLPAYAKGLKTDPDWTSSNLGGWEKPVKTLLNERRGQYEEPGQNDETLAATLQGGTGIKNDSVTLQTTSASSRSENKSKTYSFGFTLFDLFGLSREQRSATEVTTEGTSTFEVKFTSRFKEPDPAADGEQFSKLTVRPRILREKAGQHAFFVPDIYRRQAFQPFCVIYEVTSKTVYKKKSGNRNAANVRDHAVETPAPGGTKDETDLATDRAVTVKSGSSETVSSESPLVVSAVARAEDAPSAAENVALIPSVPGPFPQIRLTTPAHIDPTLLSQQEIRGTASGSGGKVQVSVRYPLRESGEFSRASEAISVADDGSWSFQIPHPSNRRFSLIFRAVADKGVESRPVRVVVDPGER